MSKDAARRRERYHTDPEFRAKVIAANRVAFKRKYENDPEWREAYKEKCKLARRKAREDPAYRAAERERARQRAAEKRK